MNRREESRDLAEQTAELGGSVELAKRRAGIVDLETSAVFVQVLDELGPLPARAQLRVLRAATVYLDLEGPVG